MIGKPDFLRELERQAAAAQAEELRFRRSFADELRLRERERAFAFRRAGLMARLAEAAGGAGTAEESEAAQIAAFRRDLGWRAESEAHSRMLAALAPVLAAIRAALSGDAEADPLLEMARFEDWYAAETGKDFLALFDQDVFEAPLVEF